MKKNLVVSLIAGLTAANAYSASKIEAGQYAIDPMHSKVGFEIPHLVISTVEGSFRSFEGALEVPADFSNMKVSAKVAIDSIDTGVAKRNDHLKSPDFFDAKKHPQMSFESSAVRGSPESFQLEGDLTIRGVKKRVKFDGKYLGSVTDGYGNRKVAFQATTRINRKDFGLTWSSMVEAGPVVGDELTISLKIQAAKQAAAVKTAAK
jgi:polyisoprenoid-binding protein YceI